MRKEDQILCIFNKSQYMGADMIYNVRDLMTTLCNVYKNFLPYSLKYTLYEDVKGAHNLLLKEVQHSNKINCQFTDKLAITSKEGHKFT